MRCTDEQHAEQYRRASRVGADIASRPIRLPALALAGGATNFSVNGLAPAAPTCSRPGAFVRHNVGAAYLTARWPMAGRTSPGPHGNVAGAICCARVQRHRVLGTCRRRLPLVTHGSAASASTPSPGQFVTFAMPAYAEQAIAGATPLR